MKQKLLITILFALFWTDVSYGQVKERKVELNIAYYRKKNLNAVSEAIGENQKFIGRYSGEFILSVTYKFTPKYGLRFGALYNRVFYQIRDYSPSFFCDRNNESSHYDTFSELNTLGVPIAFVYNYNLDDRKDIYLVVGNIVNFKRKHIYEGLLYECSLPKVIVPILGEHFRKLNNELYLGIGFKVKTYKSTINIEPRVKYSATDITTEDVKQKIFSFGLLFGVNL